MRQQSQWIGQSRRPVLCFFALLCLLATGLARSLPEQQDAITKKKRPGRDFIDDDGVKVHWALIVAGSNGWWNYRHQADVSHAYQVLRAGGLMPERIIVMMFDDLVTDTNNPKPGQLFNRPGGPDVYKGMHVDYRQQDVTADIFLAVLEGNKTAVEGKGTGKVIDSGPQDRVFVFYSDHGSPGVLGMPSGPFVFADELMGVLKRKHSAGGYREMTLYIEACESGSMFEGLLGPDLPVYATTAANAEESSWGTYCPGMDVPVSEGFDTCMGDLYSVAWMEDTECQDSSVETLGDQFDSVKLRTSNNFTYSMGSHVMQYGQTRQMRREHTGDYLGYRDASACMKPSSPFYMSAAVLPARMALDSTEDVAAADRPLQALQAGRQHSRHGHLPQREADLVPLRLRVARARSPAELAAAQAALSSELSRRSQVDQGFERATRHLLLAPRTSRLLVTLLGAPWSVVFSSQQQHGRLQGDNRLAPQPQFVQQLLTQPLNRAPGTSVVDDWDCLRGMVAAYSVRCGPMDQYTMKHTRVMANLCNADVRPSELSEALLATKACAVPSQGAAAATVVPTTDASMSVQ